MATAMNNYEFLFSSSQEVLKIFLSKSKKQDTDDADTDTENMEGSGSGGGEIDDNEEGDVPDTGAKDTVPEYSTNVEVQHSETSQETTGG